MAKIQLFELGGGAIAVNIPSREKCFCLTYFVGRPDVNRALRCAKRIGVSDSTTTFTVFTQSRSSLLIY